MISAIDIAAFLVACGMLSNRGSKHLGLVGKVAYAVTITLCYWLALVPLAKAGRSVLLGINALTTGLQPETDA